jgi:hypothetical protein
VFRDAGAIYYVTCDQGEGNFVDAIGKKAAGAGVAGSGDPLGRLCAGDFGGGFGADSLGCRYWSAGSYGVVGPGDLGGGGGDGMAFGDSLAAPGIG